MFKVGDRVRCKDPGNNIGLDYGSVHKVLALPYKDMVTVSIVRNGADSCIRVYAFRFELIVTCPTCGKDPCACDDDVELGAKRPAPKLRVGDILRTKVAFNHIPENTFVTITQIDGECFFIDHGDTDLRWVWVPEQFALASRDEPKLAKEEKTYKHAPLPARALTSWPGLHEKMAVAKLLDELKDD